MLPCAQLSFELELTIFLHKDFVQIPRRLSFAEKGSLQLAKQEDRRQCSDLCSHDFLRWVFIVKVGVREERGLEVIGGK